MVIFKRRIDMSEGQKQILQMLAENKISVEDAERLLKALKEGDQKREEHSKRDKGARSMSTTLESLGETLAGIGPMIKNALEDVAVGMSGDELTYAKDEDFETIPLDENGFEVQEGHDLYIVSTKKEGRRSCDLNIKGGEEKRCVLEAEDIENIRVLKGDSLYIVKWTGGYLKAMVPSTVKKLKAKTRGGDVTAENISSPLSINTLGGDLEALGMKTDFNAKTMGGDINVTLEKDWIGEGTVHTMGGDIDILLPNGVSTSLKATTMGGKIKVSKELGEVESKNPFPGSSVKVNIGSDSPASHLSIKTMGGNINLRSE